MTSEPIPSGAVELRDFDDDDAPLLFEWMRDPESVRMAAFTTADPDDREQFERWLARNRANPQNLIRTILLEGRPVGTISTFDLDDEREISYWVERSAWGRGVASRALSAMLRVDGTRPLTARVATANVGSATVLRRAAFVEVGRDTGFAAGVNAEVEETIFRLD